MSVYKPDVALVFILDVGNNNVWMSVSDVCPVLTQSKYKTVI